MEFFIAEEGVPINLGPDGGSIAYFGSEIDFQYETEAPHGDVIFSAKLPLLERSLPFWLYGRNLLFLDAYYLLAETVKKGSWSPICSILPTLTVYIVKKPYKSLKSSGLQSFFLCYQMCVQIFIL